MLEGLSLNEAATETTQDASATATAELLRESHPSATLALRFVQQMNVLGLSLVSQQLFGQKYGHIAKFNVKVPIGRGEGGGSQLGHSITSIHGESLFENMVELLGNVQEIYDPQDMGRKNDPVRALPYPHPKEQRATASEIHEACTQFWKGPREVARILLNGGEDAYMGRIPKAPHADPLVTAARKFLQEVVGGTFVEPEIDLHGEYARLCQRHLKGSLDPSWSSALEASFGRPGPFPAPKDPSGADLGVSLVDVCIARTLLGFATGRDTFKASWDPYGRSPLVRKFLYELFSDGVRRLLQGGGRGSPDDKRKETSRHFALLSWVATRFEPGTERTVFTSSTTKPFLERAEEAIARLSAMNGAGGRGLVPCVALAAEELVGRIRQTTGRQDVETDEEADVRLETAQDLRDLLERYNRGYDAPPPVLVPTLPLAPDELPFARRTLLLALATAAEGPGAPFYPTSGLSDRDVGRFDRLRLRGRLATPQTLALYAQFAQFLMASASASAPRDLPSPPAAVLHHSMHPPRWEEVMEKALLQARIEEEERGTVWTQLLLPTHTEDKRNAEEQPMSHRFPDLRRVTVFAGQSPVDLQVVRYVGCEDPLSPACGAVQLQAELLRFFTEAARREAGEGSVKTPLDLLRGGSAGWTQDFRLITEDLACQYHPVVDAFAMISMRAAREVMAKDAVDLLFAGVDPSH